MPSDGFDGRSGLRCTPDLGLVERGSSATAVKVAGGSERPLNTAHLALVDAVDVPYLTASYCCWALATNGIITVV